MAFLGGLLGAMGAIGSAVKASSKGGSSSSSSSSSSYDKWLKDNPSYFVSSQDDALARTNPMFGSSLMGSKNDYYKAYAAGDRSAMDAANQGLNTARDVMGGYTGGKQGDRFDVTRPYTQANTVASGMRQGNNDLAREMYAKMVQQGTNRLNAQKGEINRGYDDAAQKAYISYMQGQRDMPQQMASLGMTGGASESALLGAQAAYQGNQNNISVGRNKAITDVDLAIQDLIASGDLQTAQYILQNAEKNVEGYTNASFLDIGRRDTLDQQAIQNAYQQAGLTGMYNGTPTLGGQQLAMGREQFELEKQQVNFNKALNLLQMGFGSAEVAAQLGIPLSEVQRYAAYVQNQMNGGTAGGGSGRSGSSRGRSSKKSSGGSYSGSYGATADSSKASSEIATNAVSMFKKKSKKESLMASMLTRSEWVRHKNSGNDKSGASDYEKYEDYVNDYKQYVNSL